MLSFFSRGKKQREAPLATITNGPGTYAVEVVGESHYQKALEKICGGKSEDGHEKTVDAYLVREDDNAYDRFAVQVIISGELVGYLDRETARSFRKTLAKVAPPNAVAKCLGLIVGGWDRGEDEQGHFGVKLDLPLGE